MAPSSWLLRADDGTLLTDPIDQDVRRVIDRMDGRTRSFVRLECEGPESLWVAWGDNGKLLVILMKDEKTQETPNLVDPNQGRERGPDDRGGTRRLPAEVLRIARTRHRSGRLLSSRRGASTALGMGRSVPGAVQCPRPPLCRRRAPLVLEVPGPNRC